jgi:SAM-dependent methyltransferase
MTPAAGAATLPPATSIPVPAPAPPATPAIDEAAGVHALQQKYALSYHIHFALLAERLVGLRDQQVLEVGGSLPAGLVLGELGARGWLAVEEMDYWDETLSTGHVQGTPPAERTPPLRLRDAGPAALGGHRVCHGRIEDLPSALEASFDRVFSIAAFEHIGRLPLALERMHAALKPGGRLFSLFSPVWSAHDGHHLPEIEDAAGRHHNFGRSPIPPWGHLLMRPMELFDHLLAEGCDRATAQQIVYFVHNSGHINRMFLDDHLQIVERSPLRVLQASRLFPRPVPPEVQQRLEAMYPGRRDFGHNGLLLVLERPAAAH